ncbi:VRR-NUC domain-containing protein [Vibrio sp. HN007]|uniref:VRR-NUC domain-containing protein n=1 Tax=Vibrio iocasae TaxID=3098914 RepID=UPI0035D45667
MANETSTNTQLAEPQLSPHYYLDNFRKLTSHALCWYQDLLYQSEREWIERFEQLPLEAQCLLVRLLSRKGECFRSDKLNYSEIKSIQAAAKALASKEFIEINPRLLLSTIATNLLTKPEIIKQFPNENKSLKKQALIESVCEKYSDEQIKLTFDIYQLINAQIIDVLLLLFFANSRQDLTQFVVSDLGIQKFESYTLSTQLRFFDHRIQIEALLQLSKLSEELYLSSEVDEPFLDHLTEELPQKLTHHYVKRKTEKLINLIAREYERLECTDKALYWFKQTTLPPSRERQVRILEKLNLDNEAALIVEDMLATPIDQPEHEVAQRLDTRLRRKAGEKITRPVNNPIREDKVTLDLSSKRVELAVKEHYEANGWQAFYTENSLLNALFGLAFWDIIFSPVEGAFINPYQQQPLDLFHPDFIQRRKSQITERLSVLKNDHKKIVRNHFNEKKGTANTLVNWSIITPELLELALSTFSSEQIVSLFEVQLSDLRHFRSGMPDLIAFKNGEFLWIEVKGPGDKLQDSQKRWIKHFELLKTPYLVCYVNSK